MCICVYVHMCICAYLYICISVYVYVCIYIYICICVYVCVWAQPRRCLAKVATYSLWRGGVTCLFKDVSHETPDVTPCRTSPPMPFLRTRVLREAPDVTPCHTSPPQGVATCRGGTEVRHVMFKTNRLTKYGQTRKCLNNK